MPTIPTLLALLTAPPRTALESQYQALLARCPMFATVVRESK